MDENVKKQKILLFNYILMNFEIMPDASKTSSPPQKKKTEQQIILRDFLFPHPVGYV